MTYLLPPLWMADKSSAAETLTFGHGVVVALVLVALLLLASLAVWVWRETRQLRRDIEAAEQRTWRRASAEIMGGK